MHTFLAILHILVLPLVLLESALDTGPSSPAEGHLEICLGTEECPQVHDGYTTAAKNNQRA